MLGIHHYWLFIATAIVQSLFRLEGNHAEQVGQERRFDFFRQVAELFGGQADMRNNVQLSAVHNRPTSH